MADGSLFTHRLVGRDLGGRLRSTTCFLRESTDDGLFSAKKSVFYYCQYNHGQCGNVSFYWSTTGVLEGDYSQRDRSGSGQNGSMGLTLLPRRVGNPEQPAAGTDALSSCHHCVHTKILGRRFKGEHSLWVLRWGNKLAFLTNPPRWKS